MYSSTMFFFQVCKETHSPKVKMDRFDFIKPKILL